MAEPSEQRGTVDGLETHWWQAEPAPGATPVLYVHGVPTAGWEWREFLRRSGGVAPDLPGFGASAKIAGFDYSIAGYARWLQAFADAVGLERFSLAVHDWGAVGLALAQAAPERIERLVIADAVPLLSGYRWHRLARGWRTPVLGEMLMGFSWKAVARRLGERSIPAEHLDRWFADFDHGTQRAILKLYRSAPPAALARAGEALAAVRAPALVVWGERDPYIPAAFAARYAEALGGAARVRVVEGAGHWPWLAQPGVVGEIAGFLGAGDGAREPSAGGPETTDAGA